MASKIVHNKGKAQMAGKGVQFPWRSPPPNIYYMKNLMGYIDHDITKKLYPAYSLVRYVYPPRTKVKVSTAPFIKALRRKQKKKAKSDGSQKLKKKKKAAQYGKNKFRRRQDDDSLLSLDPLDKEPRKLEVFDTYPCYKPPPLKYRLTKRTSSMSDYFLTSNAESSPWCQVCEVPSVKDIRPEKCKNKEIHGVQFIAVSQSQSKPINLCKPKTVKKMMRTDGTAF